MRKELNMGMVMAIAAAVVVVLGMVAWKVLARPTVQVTSPQEQQQVQRTMQQEYAAEARRGGMPAPTGMPAPGPR